MAVSKRISWEKDIRKIIHTDFGSSWRVNGEQKRIIHNIVKESKEALQTVQSSIIDEPVATGSTWVTTSEDEDPYWN